MDKTHASDLRDTLLTLLRVFKGSSRLYVNLAECFYDMASDDMLRRSIGLHSFVCCLYRILYQAGYLGHIHANDIDNTIIYIPSKNIFVNRSYWKMGCQLLLVSVPFKKTLRKKWASHCALSLII